MNQVYFHIPAGKYVEHCDFEIVRPASLDRPHDNSVMFLMEKYIEQWRNLLLVKRCLIFWPEAIPVPEELSGRHAIFRCEDTRVEYCKFFRENAIRNLPPAEEFEIQNGAYVSVRAEIGAGTVIMPGAYVGGAVKIGRRAYIGSGTKLTGRIVIGDGVVIRENTVLGADGLSTDRDADGHAVTMPQFGGIQIGDGVEIGANCVIARGAIDDTVIGEGCKLDNSVFISHNVHLGRDTFVVGETIMFGSSSTGERAYISGNSTIRNKVKIGSDALVGMGTVVTKDIADGLTVLGNPARVRK